MSNNVRPQTLLDALQLSFAVALRSPEGVAEPIALLWTDTDGQWRPWSRAAQSTAATLCSRRLRRRRIMRGPGHLAQMHRRADPAGGVAASRRRADPLSARCQPAGPPRRRRLPRTVCSPSSSCNIAARFGISATAAIGRWKPSSASEDGLGLDIAKDNRTRDAMLRALPLLAPEPLAPLRGRRLEADDFDRLAIGDPVRDLLGWMSETELRGALRPNAMGNLQGYLRA